MLQILKEIILDYQSLSLRTGIPRATKLTAIKGKATVCIGVRRSGKTTCMFQVMERLCKNGVSKENILYLNFFDDRLHNLQQGKLSKLSDILEAYFLIYPDKKNTEKIYCFFDEIQDIPMWERFIDRLIRTEDCEVYITGSSAQMLSREIATQMRGRALAWEMFPFSFKEFLDAKAIESKAPWSTKNRLKIQNTFDTYWTIGGFPEILDLSKMLRIKIHQEYFNAILFRDLVERHNVSQPKAISDLAHWLVDNIASLYSINKLYGYLKSLGHSVSKATIANYINWFEDAYVFFTIRIFDASLSRANSHPKKIYCVDHSLVKSISSGILVNSGHLLENLVFLGLRRVASEIYYYKTKKGREIDFIIPKLNMRLSLVQVCYEMKDKATQKREVTALVDAMAELKLKKGVIVTYNEEREIDIDIEGGKIYVVPVWRFLLQLSEI